MIPRDEVVGFWEVVRVCLMRFHRFPPYEAQREIASLRMDLDRLHTSGAPEMIYHDEPFNVACDIAKQQLDRFAPAVAEEYHRMLNRAFRRLASVPDEQLAEFPPRR